VSIVSRIDEIDALVRDHTGTRGVLSEETDLHSDLGLTSLDLDEFLAEFAKRFDVDLSGFLWYFHTEEDDVSPGRLFFAAPQERVQRIPLRLALLYRAVELGRWPVDYPEHSLPRRRWDLVFNQCLAAGFAAWLVWWLAQKLF
jgi:acyl carrier protein